MADFLESAKSMVSAAVSRTSWEAQKQLRLRSKQSEIDKLLEQRQQLLDELGQVAMNLYQQGRLSDQQLSRLCASIQELDHDVQNRETQLQEIKSEAYTATQFAPAATPDYTPPAVSPSPPASQTSRAGTQTQLCPNCGSTVRPNALYCRSCGTKIR
jgi:ribosomal protein L40E